MGKCQTSLAHLVHDHDAEESDGNDPKLKSTMSSSDASSASAPAPPSALSIFHEDILLAILSFVADVPFEMVDSARAPIDSHSTLTHTLPLVSKQFHKLTLRHDLYWKHALLRLLHKQPCLWDEGMKRVIFDAKCDELREEIMERNRSRTTRRRDKRTKDGQNKPQSVVESKVSASLLSDPDSPSDDNTTPPLSNNETLLEEACTAIQSHPPQHHTATPSGTYQRLHQSIVLQHIRYQAPVFCMPTAVRLGEAFGLHFFESRYRLLISEVMANYPVSARRGAQISPMVPGLFPPDRGQTRVLDDDIKAAILDLLEKNEPLLEQYQLPTFIHAHQTPVRRNTPATIVQVERCGVAPDGSADVFLKPLAYVWLEEIWERPGTGGLIEARGIRMGLEASDKYERWSSMLGFGRGDGRGHGQMLPIP